MLQNQTISYHSFSPSIKRIIRTTHYVLGEYLKQFVAKKSEWDDWLELAMFSYNTSVHEGTKCKPYKLFFGKLAREPSSEPLAQQEKLQTYDNYLINFVTQLHEMRTQACVMCNNEELRSGPCALHYIGLEY